MEGYILVVLTKEDLHSSPTQKTMKVAKSLSTIEIQSKGMPKTFSQ